MKPSVMIVATVGANGLRVTESFFHLGRRVVNRKRWLEIRGW